MRDALGPGGRIRVDANGAWSVSEAVAAVRRLERAAGGLEYVEQPCASVEELAVVRRAVDVPIAADESIRRAADPYRVRDLEAADIAVLKVQPLGGVRACLRIAEDIGLPVVVSSALETSVGIAAGVALAAALPELPYACGLATVRLLEDDVATEPLLPVDGVLPVRATVRRRRRRSTDSPPHPPGSPTGRRGWPRCGRSGRRIARRDQLVDRPRARRPRRARPAAASRTWWPRPARATAPLLFAAYDADAAGVLRLHTRVDERTAGYLALGLAKVSHRRAAVLCTSGTAVANLHPAMLEAAHAGVPLVALTADRPARFRGTNANQTTDQVGVFGPLVPLHDLSGASRGMLNTDEAGTAAGPSLPDLLAVDGPVHVNVAFDEPLVPDDRWEPAAAARERDAASVAASVDAGRESTLPLGPRTVVVAGDDAGPPARVLAEAADWPLLAEPTSGSRTGTHALRCYRLLLDGEPGSLIERVVVVGHPTLSRPVTRLLGRADVEVWSVPADGRLGRAAVRGRPRRRAPDRRRPGRPRLAARPGARPTPTVARALDELLADEAGLTPYDVAGAVARQLPAGGLLVVGASSPLRDLDLMVPRYDVGGRRKVIANRGLSGIDGTVSTAIGAALGRPSSSRALALVGDVTFLHDATALVLGPDEPRPDLTIVVVNDDGGSIFAMLEQGDPAYADRFDRLFGTPHGVDLAALCAATRTPHWRVDSLAELEHALANPNGGIEVVEAVVRRDNRRDLDERIRALGRTGRARLMRKADQ